MGKFQKCWLIDRQRINCFDRKTQKRKHKLENPRSRSHRRQHFLRDHGLWPYDLNIQNVTLAVPKWTRRKVLSWEYRSPRKRNSRPPASVILCWVSWVENVLVIYYASVCLHWKKIPGLRAFLDSNLHTRRAIVTANELGLAFPLGTFPKNCVQIRPRFV